MWLKVLINTSVNRYICIYLNTKMECSATCGSIKMDNDESFKLKLLKKRQIKYFFNYFKLLFPY